MTFKSWMIPLVNVVILALNFLWLPFLKWNDTLHPFLFKNYKGDIIEISRTQYVDYSIRSLPYLIILALLIKFVPKYRIEFIWSILFWAAWFFDYFITDNEPLRHWHFIPLSYSAVMAICLLAWLGYDYYLDSKKNG